MANCRVCGKEVTNEKFCPNCGSAINNENKVDENSSKNQNIKYCDKCGEPIDESMNFCSNCGNNFSDTNIGNTNIENNINKNYDNLIYVGYGLIIATFIAGYVFAFAAMAIGIYILTRPNIKTSSSGNGSFLSNPTENAFVHGILLIILPIPVAFIGWIIGLALFF